VVQTFSPNRADDSLAVSVLPRRPAPNHDRFYPKILNRIDRFLTVDPVSIPDQISRCRVERKRLGQLQARPFCRWICRDVEVDDSSPFERQDHEDIECSKCRRVNREEVDGDHLGHVVPDERPPHLCRRAGLPNHVFGDGGFADVISEFEQLTVDAGCAP